MELQTRSGNTATPDSTWSDWSATIRLAAGEQIKSPQARFIQWRGTLKNSGSVAPRLREVTVSYLPRNIAPRVTSVTILPEALRSSPFPNLRRIPAPSRLGSIRRRSETAFRSRRDGSSSGAQSHCSGRPRIAMATPWNRDSIIDLQQVAITSPQDRTAR